MFCLAKSGGTALTERRIEMAIEKYIIDKSDLTALLRGECLPIQPKGNIKGFCVEIAGELTNGELIKAMFPNCKAERTESGLWVNAQNVDGDSMFSAYWWDSPYRKE